MKNDVEYWVKVNGVRYLGVTSYSEAEFIVKYFKMSGCTDELEIEADVPERSKNEK